jgi:surface protein
MAQMFNYCRKIEKLDVGSFDTSSVTSMSEMFGRMDNLT